MMQVQSLSSTIVGTYACKLLPSQKRIQQVIIHSFNIIDMAPGDDKGAKR